MMKLLIGLVMFVGIGFSARAQEDSRNPKKSSEYSYQKDEIRNRKVVPYPSLREADVMYVKRVERIIDSREKKNQVMNWPKSPLSRIVYNMVTTGEANQTGKLKAYRNDSLSNAMTVDYVSKLGGTIDPITIHDPNAPEDDIYAVIDTYAVTKFDYTEVKRWKIVEEWIFDKQRSMFFPRIIALAPLYTPTLNGVPLSETPMFYVSYADLRPLLVNEEVFNRQNDGQRLSYYDFFEQRMFSSYITKESNDKDFAIKEFAEFKDAPLDALYESERIKANMANWEQDLWEQ
jgi:gliding motility associated protien GldN